MIPKAANDASHVQHWHEQKIRFLRREKIKLGGFKMTMPRAVFFFKSKQVRRNELKAIIRTSAC